MICLITTAASSSITSAQAFTLGGIAAAMLVVFLSIQVVGANEESRFLRLGRYLEVAVLPLLVVFGFVIVMEVISAIE